MTILPEGPTLKPSGFQHFSKAHNPLSFNVGPEGKKGAAGIRKEKTFSLITSLFILP
jgi:hypothetical protein